MSHRTPQQRWGVRGQLAVFAALAALACYLVSHFAAMAAQQQAERVAHRLATANEAGSVKRSVETCSRANTGRAYLRLRAREVESRTAVTAKDVFAILDCNATVRNGGVPVPLPESVQQEYLRIYRGGRVPILRDGHIIGTESFRRYFGVT